MENILGDISINVYTPCIRGLLLIFLNYPSILRLYIRNWRIAVNIWGTKLFFTVLETQILKISYSTLLCGSTLLVLGSANLPGTKINKINSFRKIARFKEISFAMIRWLGSDLIQGWRYRDCQLHIKEELKSASSWIEISLWMSRYWLDYL